VVNDCSCKTSDGLTEKPVAEILISGVLCRLRQTQQGSQMGLRAFHISTALPQDMFRLSAALMRVCKYLRIFMKIFA